MDRRSIPTMSSTQWCVGSAHAHDSKSVNHAGFLLKCNGGVLPPNSWAYGTTNTTRSNPGCHWQLLSLKPGTDPAELGGMPLQSRTSTTGEGPLGICPVPTWSVRPNCQPLQGRAPKNNPLFRFGPKSGNRRCFCNLVQLPSRVVPKCLCRLQCKGNRAGFRQAT